MNVRRRFVWRRGSEHTDVSVESRDARRVTVGFGGEETIADFAKLVDGRSSVILPSGRQLTGRAVARAGGDVETWVGARRVHLDLADPLQELAAESNRSSGGAKEICARIPGRVVEVRVASGDRIDAGTTLLVLEAMKMQNEIRADCAGLVTSVECSAGQTVETGALLVRVEADPVA
ncbi:MAG TPA: biotin/lipoyl-containing protein [Thermoanaerobaculia bacterium]|jgi:biotin carboxyl carrier protein|nr:biotin/lipoyl-containing protein [Thermoanaerobaculia bacterium]